MSHNNNQFEAAQPTIQDARMRPNLGMQLPQFGFGNQGGIQGALQPLRGYISQQLQQKTNEEIGPFIEEVAGNAQETFDIGAGGGYNNMLYGGLQPMPYGGRMGGGIMSTMQNLFQPAVNENNYNRTLEMAQGGSVPRQTEQQELNADQIRLAEEFMDSLPPEQKQSFLQMLMEKPLEAFNIVVNALKNKINGEEEEGFVPDKYISYDSQGNATIGQRSIAKSSGPATDFRGTDLYSDYRSYPDTVRGRDNIKRRIDMDMGQPVVPRRIVDGGEYEDYNDPENDAIFDRGKLERGRFQSQDRTAKMIGREELKKRMMDSYYDENRPPNFGRLESDARRGVLNKLDR